MTRILAFSLLLALAACNDAGTGSAEQPAAAPPPPPAQPVQPAPTE